MKKIIKTSVSLACVLAMMLSLLCIAPLTASAKHYDGVQPTNVQRQWDSKWKNYYIGGRTMYDTACGIFSIVNAVGYATGNTMDVMEVARWAYSIKAFNYYSGGTTRGALYPYLQAKYGTKYGFTVDCNGGGGYWAGASSSKLKNHLMNGGTVIGHVKGHFITVVEYDPNTSKFRIFDSAPSSSRKTNVTGEYGYGDAWVTQSWFSTSTKLTLDWFCLVTPTGTVINNGDGPTPTNTADKIGTWQVNSNAPESDKLNVRTGVGSSYDVVGTVQEGDIVYTGELVGGSSNWGKIKNFATGVEGYASIMNHADYIGVDALGGTPSLAWGDLSTYIDEKGQRVITNNSATEHLGYDLMLPIDLGIDTTPYMSLQVTPNYGNGWYFGISQNGSGYWMMRDHTSSSQLVQADTAPWMTTAETLEIDLRDWWKPADNWKINVVRIYVAPASSITVNYFYFAATKGKVTDTTYNLIRQTTPIINENLMLPNTLSIADRSKAGSYTYDNGKLTVNSNSVAGYEVVFDVNKDYKPTESPNWLFDLVATTGFDIQIIATTSQGDHSFGLVSEFWPSLCDGLVDGYLPAETYKGVADINSCYTWNNFLPADGVSTIKQVKIVLSGNGSLTINSLQLSNTNDFVNYADGVVKADGTQGDIPVPTEPIKGDIDYDGEVSTTDARDMLKFSIGSLELTDAQKELADYDEDGALSTGDIREMLKALLV